MCGNSKNKRPVTVIIFGQTVIPSGSSVLPAQAPNLQDRGRSARLTSLAPPPPERGSGHFVPHTPHPLRTCLRTSFSSHADCPWHNGDNVPKVHHLLEDYWLFLEKGRRRGSPYGSSFFVIPRVQKRPHSLPTRPFLNFLQTLHILSADCHSAEDRNKDSPKHANPSLSTFTARSRFTLIPSQNFPACWPKQPLDFPTKSGLGSFTNVF